MSKVKYDYEKALFTGAVNRLSLAQQAGIDTDGTKEIIKLETRGQRILFHGSLESYSPDVQEYFQKLGGYVELAVELSKSELTKSDI